MAGLQTDGFRINQTPSVVSALDPAKHSIDPSLLIRGLKDGMKFGSDIMAELDELSLRPDKLKAAKTKLQADTAVDSGRIATTPGVISATNAKNQFVTDTTPTATAATISANELSALQNGGAAELFPKTHQLATGTLNSQLSQQAFVDSVQPLANTVTARDLMNKTLGVTPPPAVTPIDGTGAVYVVGQDGRGHVVQPATAPSQKMDRVSIKNPVTGHDEIWSIKYDAANNEIARVKVGDAPGTEGKIRATAATVAKLTGSLDLLKNARAVAQAYRDAGKGGPKEAVLANAAQTKAGMNPLKVGLRSLGGSLADPDTLKLNSAIKAASNEIQNALFGSALTEGEAANAIGLLPQTDDLADPKLMVDKIDGAIKFISTKLDAFSKEMPQVVSPDAVAPAGGADLTDVPVNPVSAAPAAVPLASIPAGTEIGADAAGNRFAKINGAWVPIQ